ncbi:class I SAM-dependent methyltransferase [Legionella worsleiensis]|uniref:Methyltransferase type 11 domain-containing protein n=1 Tax=Legionella worsleiensis TaxID=45076 RepID=A0A0W1ALC6_9GAMM|nr:class I SAM-dependent methyltransferase [Legionella worsleiensis]KTD81992.1 hypothetical protein Lwor_0295 [Legionella worsleiensis]STY30377.1 biotin biosynthesis protein BioC [Legionella worsleiensis]
MDEVNREYIRHFNQATEHYLLCRPSYPPELFNYLAQLVKHEVTVWDCGTGNGQAAKALAEHFAKVIATDINQAQLDVAMLSPNIQYLCTPAEKTPIPSGSIGLVTVAQALHWFNFSLFYDEVRRVSTPEGVIAVWCYGLGLFDDDVINGFIKKLYNDILGSDYWPKERLFIDENYKTIPFPFRLIDTPELSIKKRMNFEQLIGYLSTWSAVKEFQDRQGLNPINLIMNELLSSWGNVTKEREITWPLYSLIGAIHS